MMNIFWLKLSKNPEELSRDLNYSG